MYSVIYSFSALSTNGQSLIFGTPEFWSVSLSLVLVSLIFGSLVGLMQGVPVIRRVGAVPRQLFWWGIIGAITGAALIWVEHVQLKDQ